MKIWATTLTHLDGKLLEASLTRIYETATPPLFEHVLVDHHWPLDYWAHRHHILQLAERFRCKVMSPYQNMGGHGGYSWAWANLPLADDDLVIGIDGDAFPKTPGWNNALRNAMVLDPTLAAVSLKIDADLNTKVWTTKNLQPEGQAVNIMWPAHGGLEMFNVTMWRASFLKSAGGLHAGRPYYGFVEAAMHAHMKSRGLRHVYLADYSEQLRPFDADPRYQQWKADHINGYPGNFDQWLQEHGGG